MTYTPAEPAHRPPSPPTTPGLTIAEHDAGDRYDVTLAGEIDVAVLADLRAVTRRVRASTASDIHLHMAGVTFMDSSGLSWIVRLHPLARARRGRIVLHDVAPHIWQVFTVTGISLLVRRED